MDFSSISSFLNSPTVASLAGTLLQKPTPAPSAPAPVIYQSAPPISTSSGMSTNTMIMIGVGAVAAILGLFFAFRK